MRRRRSISSSQERGNDDSSSVEKVRKRLQEKDKVKKNKNAPSSEEVITGEFGMGISGEILTLLDVPGRKELPEIPKRAGRKCKLEEIVNFAPEVYRGLITKIRCGVSFNVASETVNINESTFHDWGWKGKNDLNDGLDTYFSRFYTDVRRAAANITADCEMSVTARNPIKYLTQGGGRIFGNPWGKGPANRRSLPNGNGQQALPSPEDSPQLPPDEAIDAVFTVIHEAPEDDDEGQDESGGREDSADNSVPRHADSEILREVSGVRVSRRTGKAQGNNGKTKNDVLQLTAEQELRGMEVWEEMGLLNLTPELKKAFQDQTASDPNEE
jgi:hypothetical protein